MKLRLSEFFYVSNLLSLSRIVLVLPVAYLLKINSETGNIILIPLSLIAASTDFFDGYFSRKLNQVTDLGKILDPLADKIGMAIVLIALIIYRDWPVPLTVLLLYRDVLIVLIGGIGMKRLGSPVMANRWGKINTTVVSSAGLLLIFNVRNVLLDIFIVASYATVLISGYFYLVVGEKLLFEKRAMQLLFRVFLIIITLLFFYWLARWPLL